jgi:hypothetical protein
MMDSWVNLKLPGDYHPKQRQVCTIRQEELEIENLIASFSDTSAKFQDMLVVLDDNTLLLELKNHVQIYDASMASVVATTRDKGGIDAAILAKNWRIGIEASKRMRLVTTQRGTKRMIHPSLPKGSKPITGS